MITFETGGATITVPEGRIVEIRRLRPGRFKVSTVGDDRPITVDQEPTRRETVASEHGFEVWQSGEDADSIFWMRSPVLAWSVEIGVLTGFTESLKPICDDVDLPYARGLLVDLRGTFPRAKSIGLGTDPLDYWAPLHEVMEAVTGKKFAPCEPAALKETVLRIRMQEWTSQA